VSETIKFMSKVTLKWKGITVSGRYINEIGDFIIIKLDNGYNMSFKKDGIEIIEALEPDTQFENNNHKKVNGNKVGGVVIIGTGGTIASYVDYKTGAVKPLKNFQEALFNSEELETLGNIEDEILFNIFSEDMEPDHWIEMARKAYERMKEGKALVFAHGTDTMSFSASALSFMIENNHYPIIFTGSQRSSDRPSSDAYFNLKGAIKLAATSDLGDVSVVMHSDMSDDFLSIHKGVRVRKMHTSRRDAFKSINDIELGRIDSMLNIKLNDNYRKIKRENDMILYDKFEKMVSLIYYYPGIDKEIFFKQIDKSKGSIIAGTGLGHIKNEFVHYLSQYRDEKIIGVTSQCLYGSVNLNVYSTGRNMLSAGLIPLKDMLPETAYVKLGFLLGNFEFQRAKELLNTDMRGEISDRRTN